MLHSRNMVRYEFVTSSTPTEWLQQYFTLRQQVYTEYWKLKNFRGEEDIYDQSGHILLVMQENRCVGGVRLIIRPLYTSTLLPMETEDFQLMHQLPELMLEGTTYGEMCRAALLPEFRDGSYSNEMYRYIALLSKALHLKYLFAVAPVAHARKVRMAYNTIGLHTEVRNDIIIPALPTYEGIEMRLILAHLTQWANNTDDHVVVSATISSRQFSATENARETVPFCIEG